MLTENRHPSSGLVLRVGQITDFDQPQRDGARQLLELVFDAEMSDADWEHGLSGTHVMAWKDDLLVGHVSLDAGRLLYGGQALRTGYVDAFAVHPDRQRRGIGGSMMDVVEAIIVSAFELGALSASAAGAAFYRKRSWLEWHCPATDVTPYEGHQAPQEPTTVFVFSGTRDRVAS